METDILIQGFKEAETKYGLRYTTFTGDGDSSVHASLVTQVPGWGHTIRKVECANHAVKCYRGALEKLVTEKPHYKGRDKLTVAMRKRLTTAARCAIKMRSTESDAKRATELLRQDLINGPRHCFGIHSGCSTDYCKVVRSAQAPPTSGTAEATTSGTGEASTSGVGEASTSQSCAGAEPESLRTVASQEGQFWRDATDEEELEAVRSVAPQLPANIDPELVLDIQRVVGRLVAKADKLLGERDNTLCIIFHVHVHTCTCMCTTL